ncbi:hypothetical protein DFJ43DRAFT_1103872 [Lentinula guzmanii]|uniref:Tat pathway signal sequence n=1 Tax=Lentinula guzmanii TaxID=2804957 RepID=A0AA38J2P6_9AGAR|nr:hypothetical protein DFJ43DRAFT_1103872 [Lentinula guzmanii]
MRFSSPRLSSLLSWPLSENSTIASTVYAPLVVDEARRGEENLFLHNHTGQSKKHALAKLAFSVLIFCFGLLLGILVARFPQKGILQCNVPVTAESKTSKTLLYSPAQDAVRYEVRYFNASLRTDITNYQGTPTEDIDKNWEDLYRCKIIQNVPINCAKSFPIFPDGIVQIPASEANKLVDKTLPIPGDDGNYIVTLEVFHQLHCLNLLRKSLYPDYYSTTLIDHLDHCVDILRQALTCTIDINPLSWHWYEPRQATETKLNGAHKCVDFGKIQDWAYEHKLQTPFDESVNLQLGHDHHEHTHA